MQVGKRGEVSEEVVNLIIAVAGGIALFFLMITLWAGGYDRVDEIRVSYFEMLEGAIEVADSGGEGEFYMVDLSEVKGDRVEFYLVYFGESFTYGYSDVVYEDAYAGLKKKFDREPVGVNALCVCSRINEEKSFCRDCLNLDYAAVYNGRDKEWVFEQDNRLVVKRLGDKYVFES